MQPGKPEQSEQTLSSTAKKRRLLQGLAVKDGLIRHPFDLEFGVRTSGLVAGRHLTTGHRHDRQTTAYYGIAPSVFQGIIARWRKYESATPIDQFTFIDIGAGMGRAMLLASEHPFRAVIGVELNPTLTRIARRNITLWRAAGRAQAPMRMMCCDAIEFALPPGPCVAFLFNPFGAQVMRRLLKHWTQSLASRTQSAQFDILYVNNEQEGELERQRNFRRTFVGRIRRSPADSAADRKILLNQPDGEYAASAWEDCSMYRWTGKQK